MLRFPILGGSAALRCYWGLVPCPHVGGIVQDALRTPGGASGWSVCGMPRSQIRGVCPLDLTGGVSMTPVGWHKLLHGKKMQMLFGKGRVSECRRGIPACEARALRVWTAAWIPLGPAAPCLVHARR